MHDDCTVRPFRHVAISWCFSAFRCTIVRWCYDWRSSNQAVQISRNERLNASMLGFFKTSITTPMRKNFNAPPISRNENTAQCILDSLFIPQQAIFSSYIHPPTEPVILIVRPLSTHTHVFSVSEKRKPVVLEAKGSQGQNCCHRELRFCFGSSFWIWNLRHKMLLFLAKSLPEFAFIRIMV